MKTLLVSLALGVASIGPCASAPWVMSGQQQIDAGTSLDNPKPADTGAIGQVTDLPFIVPVGKVVCVNSYVMEGYDSQGISVIFIYTGEMPAGLSDQEKSAFRIAHGLPSAAGDSGHGQIDNMNYCFREGTAINVRLINGTSTIVDGSGRLEGYTGVYGWGVWGTIVDASDFAETID